MKYKNTIEITICNIVERYLGADSLAMLLPCTGLLLAHAKNTLPGPLISSIKDLPTPSARSWYDDKGRAPTSLFAAILLLLLLLLFKPRLFDLLNIETQALI